MNLSMPIGKEHHDMKGVCGAHAGCTLSRRCRTKRPIGLIWAWLLEGLESGSAGHCKNKEEHEKFVPSFEQREEARSQFALHPESVAWFDAECPDGDLAASGEPFVIK